MQKQIISLVVVVFIFSLVGQACTLVPAPAREGTVISDCADTIRAVIEIQPTSIPQALLETGSKQGDEFDVNDYFKALTHISMQEGYSLNYVYRVDGLGAFPILYALSDGQAPYASVDEVPENTELGDFRKHIDIQDVEQGYFEFVVMQVMAGQFYLDWHANYNDTQIICDGTAADAIVKETNSQDSGAEFDLKQQAQIRMMTNIEPLVKLTDDSAIVEVVVFTKWGGFFRQTYTISRSFPHTIEMNEENLVEYDCGIMF